jgi:hypothetical protein
MLTHRIALAAAVAFMVVTSAEANCFGTAAFQNCYDANGGNNYTINRSGSMTQMNGYNANTGSQWSQTSQTYGGTTYHNGTTNGSPWNMTEQHFGGTTTYSGMNASGQSFYKTCTQFGCY